jgi:hypothetical protein
MIGHRIELNIATEFTATPGPRRRSEGPNSGEEFLSKILRPRFMSALNAGGTLCVNLDGAIGYPTSFLEEAFGGLAREFGPEKVDGMIDIICTDEPYLPDQIRKFIRSAKLAG